MKFDFINLGVRIYSFIFPLIIIRYYYYRLDIFNNRIVAENNKKGTIVLDIGAYSGKLKSAFTKAKYLSNDIIQNPAGDIDIIADLNEGIPEIKNNSIDCIICTQVIEHLKKPEVAYREFKRILKKGGKVYLSTNLCYQEHMVPYDYFRYTRYGLRYLGESTGLQVIHLEPQGGVFHLLAIIIDSIILKLFFKENSLLYFIVFIITTPLRLVLNTLFFFLDYLDREKKWTANYEVIYQK